jgi:FdhD protein
LSTSKTDARIWRFEGDRAEERPDQLATEEPLEIRLVWQGEERVVAVTMRTLFAEAVVDRRERVVGMRHPVEPGEAGPAPNVIEVEMGEGPEPELRNLERHFFSSSACGVCGKAGLAALQLRVSALPTGPEVDPEILRALPERLRQAQGIFAATGGLHAAALFDVTGRLLAVREDVGRHNALDKLFGWAFLQGRLPLHDHLIMVSGRSSYEILQKCLVAEVPIVCAVSAPSSLAVELANRFGVTLIGFLRGDRFNVYSGVERILLPTVV